MVFVGSGVIEIELVFFSFCYRKRRYWLVDRGIWYDFYLSGIKSCYCGWKNSDFRKLIRFLIIIIIIW